MRAVCTHGLMQTLSKLLGYGMVAGGAIVKIPQLIKILLDKSVYGISYSSLVLELATNWITIVYSWYRGNPFSIYGENVFIGFQNVIIMFFFILYVRNVPKGVPQPSESAPSKYIAYFLLTCVAIFLTRNPYAWPPAIIESSMVLQILFCTISLLCSLLCSSCPDLSHLSVQVHRQFGSYNMFVSCAWELGSSIYTSCGNSRWLYLHHFRSVGLRP